MAKKTLFLIDAHALCYRSFYAIKELSTSKGQATNAVFGFVNTIKKILKDFKPDYLAVCFDSPKKTLRQQRYANYKIQRPIMPDDLISQMPIIKQAVEAFNFASYEADGYEADDIIATLSKKFKNNDLEVVIVSEDKDMFQLADKNIKFYSSRKEELFDYNELETRLGFSPKRMVDFIGLAGDQADNIPGVKGVGEVTAKGLINAYGSIENIYDNVGKIEKPALRLKLEQEKKMALLSKELAVLETDVPINIDLETLKIREPQKEILFELFSNLEFRRLAKEFATSDNNLSAAKSQGVLNQKELASLIKEIQQKGEFVFFWYVDEEQNKKELLFSLKEQVYTFGEQDIELFKIIFENEKIKKAVFDLKEFLKVLDRHDILLQGTIFDVKLAGFLARPSATSGQLSHLAWEYLKAPVDDAHKDVSSLNLTAQLYPVLEKDLKEKHLERLFEEIEIPLSFVLAKMEEDGVSLDIALLKKLSKESEIKINHLHEKLYKTAGEEFNLNSPKQLSKILFEKLGLPVVRKTKTGQSTDESVLNILALHHEVPALILEYRQIAKLKSTYIDALPQLVNPSTNRIHAQFDQAGTETGRLSSRQPNLQNIPIKTEIGREIRKAFIPASNKNVILAADYSQIELRILAHLCEDKNLMRAFADKQDIHVFTAALMFDVKEKDVTTDMRYSAKRINFGIIYGMSAFGLSKDLGISPGEAQQFIDKYFLRYPNIQGFIQEQIKFCEKNGYVLTLFNRRRYIPEIKSKNMSIRQFAQRQAINTPVQGSAADLIKLAMINVHKGLEQKKLRSKMVITVHDELVFDALIDELKTVAPLIRNEMEHPIKLKVPIVVSMRQGKNWLEMEEIQV